MAARINSHASGTAVETLHDSLQEHGYLVLRDAAPDLTRQAYTELISQVDAAPFGHTMFLGHRTKRLGGLLARSEAARELAMHPDVLAICETSLLTSAANYQLNFSGIMHLEPGASAQKLHRDESLYPVSHPCPPMIIATMWALTEFTRENGGTCVVPGSNHWPQERTPTMDEVVSVEMEPGSVLFYTGGVYHGGGHNRSRKARTGLALQYAWAWLRQEENQYIANPPDVARQYPEKLRRLIGYDYAGPFLGFAHGDDPHRVFEPEYTGYPQRSRAEIDARSATIQLFNVTQRSDSSRNAVDDGTEGIGPGEALN